MYKIRITLWALGIILLSSMAATAKEVLVLPLAEPITPLTVTKVQEALYQAQREQAQCLVLELDTPGGLVTSMRGIVKLILNSSVPVVVYVAPSGAQAASAGTFIVLAAHIAAMAPGTNIGAAHPVTMGQKLDKTMSKKIENDLAALARSLAVLRGRNARWAEKAVRESVSITAQEALKLKVIDLIALDLKDLLNQINGRHIETKAGQVVLHTKGVKPKIIKAGLRNTVLRFITDPNIAYILLMLGLAGLYLELSHPGAIFPGVVGAICLVLALYALHLLPIDYAGLALILFSGVLFFLEIKISSYGLLSLVGLGCLILGSLLLFNKTPEGLRVSYHVILPVVSVVGLFFCSVTYLAARAVFKRPTTGSEGLIGEQGQALTEITPQGGQVFVHGEIWQAFSEEKIPQGAVVTVEALEGLRLKVRKVSPKH